MYGIKGCDPGAFLLARPGLYIRELDALILFIVFKGTDLHSGYGSTVEPNIESLWQKDMMADVEALWNKAGAVNRAGFVSYPAHSAFHRSGTTAVTPSLTFGNAGNMRNGEESYMNFSSNGKHILGGTDAHYTRLAREMVYLQHNFAEHTGLHGVLDPRNLFNQLKYINDKGHTVHCGLLPFHAIEDAAKMKYWRGRYKYHFLACEQHRIRVVKHHYKENQKKMLNVSSIQPLEVNKLKKRTTIPQVLTAESESTHILPDDTLDSPLTEYGSSEFSDTESHMAPDAQTSNAIEKDETEDARTTGTNNSEIATGQQHAHIPSNIISPNINISTASLAPIENNYVDYDMDIDEEDEHNNQTDTDILVESDKVNLPSQNYDISEPVTISMEVDGELQMDNANRRGHRPASIPDSQSDDEWFDDRTDVEEDDDDSEDEMELSESRYEVKDILDRRVMVCI